MKFIRILKIIMNFAKKGKNTNKETSQDISNNTFVIKNNYGVEKDIILMPYITTIYFIPVIYQKGIYKLNELPCLIYSVEDFKELSFKEKQNIFDNYSFWYKIKDVALSNDFSILYDENKIGIDNIEVSYIDLEDKKGILSRVSFPNSKKFFQYFEQDMKKIEKIIKKLSSDAANSILDFIKSEVKKEEIFRMFLEYYGDSKEVDILFTIGTLEDYDNINKKYLSDEYVEKYGYTVNDIEEISINPGDYPRKFTVTNIDEIKSYYCSFAECGIIFKGPNMLNDINNFLYLIEISIKKILEQELDKFNLADDFKFPNPQIYD